MRTKFGLCALAAIAGLSITGIPSLASAGGLSIAQITAPIDDAHLVTLAHNTRPEAISANDRGAIADGKHMGGMELLLSRSKAKEKAFRKAIAALYDPKSPSFHQWLTNAEIGREFGVGDGDVAKISGWLGSHGLHVNGLTPDHTILVFSGTAAQVRSAFHTEIHSLNVNGVSHFSNMSDPRIPAALASVVAGVVTLHDFKPHTNLKKRLPADTSGSGSSTEFLVTPSDLATIYDMKPVFNAGITGQGQTVVVLEDTDVYKQADWNIFRAIMGLSSYTHATFTQVHPQGAAECADPGVDTGEDDGEAILDAEYASASAPDAAIQLASCDDNGTDDIGFGGLKALQNILAQNNHPNIISMSYGDCEAVMGATDNAAYTAAFQSAAAEGISMYVSSGDEDAASCDVDFNNRSSKLGIAVSGFASTPYNIAVGGTDFGDLFALCTSTAGLPGCLSTYWNTSNTASYGSAKSYIPEIPWNDSCASAVFSAWEGFATPYGTAGFCNATAGRRDLSIVGGSGGPSNCSSGSPTSATAPVSTSGSCAGTAKPSWQSGFQGIVADGVRDIPDISLFAANGLAHHYYPYCDSDPADGCKTANPANWAGAGGTSFSSPIMAGIQALINQKTGSSWGNSNTVFYALAATEYGASGKASCSSSLGKSVGSDCVFHDVTSGDIDASCTGTNNCYLPSGTNGVLSTSNSAYQPAYKTTSGWDFATGVGTPDVANLINAFVTVENTQKKHK